jgi:hypothetical protein
MFRSSLERNSAQTTHHIHHGSVDTRTAHRSLSKSDPPELMPRSSKSIPLASARKASYCLYARQYPALVAE